MKDQRRQSLELGLDAAFLFVIFAIGGFFAVTAAVGQSPTPQDRSAAIKESLAKNQAALRQYSWVETTQTSLKGEVKKTEQKQCYYGADGKVQKTPMPGAAAAAPPPEQKAAGGRRGGALKKNIVENKIEETKEYMEQVVALVHGYVPPDPQRMDAARGGGRVSVQPSATTTTLTVKDYLKPGDLLMIGFDAEAKKIQSFQVNSYVEKPKDDAVSLNVMFATLLDGTNYPQQIVLNVVAKKIQVTVTNSGYKKAGT